LDCKYASIMHYFFLDRPSCFGISRDDAGSSFLTKYVSSGILPNNLFATLDRNGGGKLMHFAIQKGRSTNPHLECDICGEHVSEPQSIAPCHKLGLTYVSCSPFCVPIALLAAYAALYSKKTG